MHDDHSETLREALSALPLFPLPGTVFFPNTLLPLHVFEPRYRQMTAAVLDTHQHMAIVQVDADAVTPVARCAAIAGLGRVVHHERLPDGRYHILLQGVARVALEAELPSDGLLYRRARARILPSCVGDGGVEQELIALRDCYARLLDHVPTCRDTLGDLPLRLEDAGVIADIVCASVLEDPHERQTALACTEVQARLAIANDALGKLYLSHFAPDQVQ